MEKIRRTRWNKHNSEWSFSFH